MASNSEVLSDSLKRLSEMEFSFSMRHVFRAEDMNFLGWDCCPLTGNLFGHWSVIVNDNWRLTFAFENGDAILVDYQDYH